jgi:hypothetical protein
MFVAVGLESIVPLRVARGSMSAKDGTFEGGTEGIADKARCGDLEVETAPAPASWDAKDPLRIGAANAGAGEDVDAANEV